MDESIEALRREKERIDRERDQIERRLQDAERREREQIAVQMLPQVIELTGRIDALKHERNELLSQIRAAAPTVGDFTYAAEDYRLTTAAVRETLKQPELLDRLLAALTSARIHVEPRAPRFRLFRDLHPVGTLHVGSRRLAVAAIDSILDPAIIREAEAINTQYPGLVAVEYASEKKERRVREGLPDRLPDGDFAISITCHASDTGSFDTVVPLALRALEHVAAFRANLAPGDETRLFERWPDEASVPVEALN